MGDLTQRYKDRQGTKILVIDIETAPSLAYAWSLFKENIPLPRLLERGRVICFAAKWVGGKRVYFYSEDKDGHDGMVAAAHDMFSDADAIVTYNGKKFDVPHLNAEFVSYGLGPARPFKHIDLYQTVRTNFRFPSNKLDYVAGELGLGHKAETGGFELWQQCMDGNKAAWRKMREYNVHDVELTEALYEVLLPWIKGHPNLAVWTGNEWACPTCGSCDLRKDGWAAAQVITYAQYQCEGCGTWVRTNHQKSRAATRAVTR